MEKVLSDFGVQPVFLAAQVVNFFILLLILRKFLYKPILKVLEKRKEVITQSLAKAEEIEKRLNEISEEEQERIMKAAAEGEKIVKQAQDAGYIILEETKAKAQEMAEGISQEAHKQLRVEKERLQLEVKTGLADIVALALEKVTGKVLTKKQKKEIIDKEVKNLS